MSVKISDLPAAGAAAGTDQLEANQSGTSRRLTVAQVATHVRSTATDTVVVAAGSASVPSIAPTGDSNTGIFFPAADTIAFSEGGVEALRLDSSGNATFAGTAAMASSFLRNRIINGDMRIDQRNAGASVTLSNAGNSFAVDRFRYYRDFAATTVTAQRSTVAPAGFTNSLLTTIVTGASTSSGSELQVSQVIEGFNVADLGWCTSAALAVTLSFWVRCSRTGTFSVTLQSNGGAPQQSYVTTYTVSAANTWEYKTVSVVGPTSGTFNAENGAGISVVFDLGSGSSFETSSLNSWVSGNRYSAAGAVKLSATTGATLHLTGVQLEVGTAATAFERRQYGQELALCQRYAYAWGPGQQYVGTYSSGLYGDANQITMLALGVNFSGMRSLSQTLTTVGTQGTDWAVQTSGGVNQTGFTIISAVGALNAQKSGHGITNSNANLQVLTSSGRIIVSAEL